MLACALALGLAASGDPARLPPRVREPAAVVAGALRGLRSGVRPAVAVAALERLYVIVPALTADRRAALEAAGLVIELPPPGTAAPRWRNGVVVQGMASAGVRAAIARLPFVRSVESAGEARTNAGSVESVGDAIDGSVAARNLLGVDGAGVTVGVISDGADSRAASIASGDLPADLELPAVPGLPPSQGDEGTALLEIVHDVAPGAHLLFAPVHTSAEMLAAIDGLASAGAQVILDDLIFTDEPKFEDGPIAQEVGRYVSGGGMYVTAAGNYARAHYYAQYVRGRGGTFAGGSYPALHAFAPGDFGDSFRIPSGVEVLAVLQWNDPFGQAGDDFDLILLRSAAGGAQVVAASTDQQNGTGNPYEALRYTNVSGATENVFLAVAEFRRVTDVAQLRLNLMVFSATAIALEHASAHEAVFGHGAVAEALTVSAADAADPVTIESFASQGPSTVLFPTRNVRATPALTAVDDVETAVGRRGAFPNPFFGTSAASPHVAGCAALLLAAGASAAIARSAVLATATDLAPAGVDPASGAGLLDCAAAARLATGRATPPVVDTVVGTFDAGAAVVVQASGHDAEGDARSAVVRVLDGGGAELGRQEVAVTVAGSAFSAGVRLRAVALARARSVAARARDATALEGAETTAALGCPGDGSLGDGLCGVGDVLGLLATEPGRRARQAEGQARSAAAALVRAGRAHDAGHARSVHHQVHVAAARLQTIVRLAGRLSAGTGPAVAARASGLATLVRAAP